jgi:antitoxin component YwqK of YwqJK toxin-antitoxin module
MEMFTFKNKVLDGKYFYWDIDGYLLISGSYTNGKKNGAWFYYWKSRVKEECLFKNDTLVDCKN